VRFLVLGGGYYGLAQAEPVGAEFAFDLKAMEMERDVERG
jgi:hypothetical protein